MWNRNYPVTPAIPAKLKNAWISNTAVADNKLYIQLCCIAYLLNNIHPENTFTQTLKELIAAYPNVDVTGKQNLYGSKRQLLTDAVLNIFSVLCSSLFGKTYKQSKFCENGTDCRPMVM